MIVSESSRSSVEEVAVAFEFVHESVEGFFLETFRARDTHEVQSTFDTRADSADGLEFHLSYERFQGVRRDDREAAWFHGFAGEFGDEFVWADADRCGASHAAFTREVAADHLCDECSANVVAGSVRDVGECFIGAELLDGISVAIQDYHEPFCDVAVFYRIARNYDESWKNPFCFRARHGRFDAKSFRFLRCGGHYGASESGLANVDVRSRALCSGDINRIAAFTRDRDGFSAQKGVRLLFD